MAAAGRCPGPVRQKGVCIVADHPQVSVSARGMLPCNISDMQTIRREYQNVLESLQAACTLQVSRDAHTPHPCALRAAFALSQQAGTVLMRCVVYAG